MKNLFIFLQLFLFLYGQTGKITGYIKDSSSNDPLVGVSVMVVGKGIGADTDQNGRYSVVNVPIGKYDIKTSIIGYASVKVTGLLVSSGRTTEQNFSGDIRPQYIANAAPWLKPNKCILVASMLSFEIQISIDSITALR